MLEQPCPSPTVPQDEQKLLELCHLALQVNVHHLFFKHLLPCTGALELLLENEQFSFFREKLTAEERQLSGTLVNTTAWGAVPVVVHNSRSARIIWFMAGKRKGAGRCRCILPPFLSAEAMEALDDAQLAAAHLHPTAAPCAWDVFSLQDCDESPIHGTSHGLIFALAFASIMEKQPLPPKCFASGVVAQDGTVHHVEHLAAKYAHVQHEDTLFLYPPPEFIADRQAVVCSTVEQGLFAMKFYAMGIQQEQLSLYQACLGDMEVMLQHMDQLPSGYFGIAKEQLNILRQHPGTYLPQLARTCQRVKQKRVHVADELKNLFTPEDVCSASVLETVDCYALFSWCITMVHLQNRSGNITSARKWADAAEVMFHQVGKPEQFEFINHRFVATRFNRFDFRPELDPEIECYLEMGEQIAAISQCDNRLLGAMYGTIAQNYGFCGPALTDEFHWAVHRAKRAFGRKYQKECQRLLAYQVYSLLDKETARDIAPLLNTYLHLDATSGPDEWLELTGEAAATSPLEKEYQITLTCRVLADTALTTISYRHQDTLMQFKKSILLQMHHPWQFTALNTGRMMVRLGLDPYAEELFRHAIAVCRSGNETLRVMALLPLAELDNLDRLDHNDLQLVQEILTMIKTGELSKEHFQLLLQARSVADVLPLLHQHKTLLFPFSYR